MDKFQKGIAGSCAMDIYFNLLNRTTTFRGKAAFSIAETFSESFCRYIDGALSGTCQYNEIPHIKYLLFHSYLKGLSIDDFLLNVHFWRQTLTRDNVSSILVEPWKSSDVFFNQTRTHMSLPFLGKNIELFLKQKVSNHKALIRRLKDRVSLREALKEEKPTIILTNHSGWQNVPWLAVFLHDYASLPYNKMTSIIGPAVVNLRAAKEVANITKLIVTIPDTDNARLPSHLSTLRRQISRRALDSIYSLTSSKDEIILMCPSGTTDLRKDGKLILRYSEKILKLLKFLNKEFQFLPISIYEKGIFSGASVSGAGHVNMSVGELVRVGQIREGVHSSKGILEGLAKGITDYNNTVVGEAVFL